MVEEVVEKLRLGMAIQLREGSFAKNLLHLGKGIKKLKEALNIGSSVETGYSIKEKRVKLNKTEYDELMKQDESTRNKGGFQNFLVGLKCRTNKLTRELVLTSSDLDRIKRYGSNPRRGGWQSRKKKSLVNI